MDFTKQEIRDLLISIFILSLIFSSFNLKMLPMTIFVIIVVFASHELSHKAIAQHYGCHAEYKIWFTGLFLGVLTALLGTGIIFAAPGAVYISPYTRSKFAFRVVHLTKREYGLMSLGGPAINITLGLILVLLTKLIPNQIPIDLFMLTANVSFFLAFFNLIPLGPLDGGKILNWNKFIWLVAIVLALGGYVFLNFF